MSFHQAIIAGTLLLSLTACGHEHAADDHHAADHEEESTVHTGSSAPGDDGLVQLTYATTAPLARLGNIFHATVTDPAGAPLTGATVALEFIAPDGSAPFSVAASAMDAGMYVSAAADFPSSGAWQVKFHVVRATDALHDHATFQLLVP